MYLRWQHLLAENDQVHMLSEQRKPLVTLSIDMNNYFK